ncbi:hypothetical protein ES703_25170 [subsurface metagenome]
MKDIERQILGYIDEQTDIEYLSAFEYGLKMGGNMKESEIKGYHNYIIRKMNKLNGDGRPHFEHDD